MLALERQRRILNLIASQRTVKTTEIAQAFGVTEETARRDFEKLEADGHLTRTHGGAYRDDANRRDIPFSSREATNVMEKRAIARCAVDQIQSGETILLDASSTTLEVARALPDMPLTVLTSALKVVLELSNRPSMRVVMLGGTLDPRSLSCIGALSEQALDSYHVQRAFLSCRGVDPVRGLSESNDEQARLKRKVIGLAESTYLMADRSKLSLKSTFFFAQLWEVSALITDSPLTPDLATALGAASVEVLIANGTQA